jgi:arsenate reductase (glutaredoxin)
MEKVKIYHNAQCSKSREGMCMLEDLGAEVEIVEYTKNPLTEQELTDLITKLGIKPKDLVRTNEDIYKTRYANRKIYGKEWVKIMLRHPELIQRPIVVKGNKAVIGRPASLIVDLLQQT